MTSGLSGREFGWSAMWRLLLFLAMMFGVPLGLFVLDRFFGDPDVTLTEAVRVTTGTFVGFALYLVFAILMIRPCWRRMRALALPGIVGLVVPVFLLLDTPFFLAGSGTGSFGPSAGSPGGTTPAYLITALGLVTAMVFARPVTIPLGQFKRRLGAAMLGVVGIVIVEFALFIGMLKWVNALVARSADEDVPDRALVRLVVAGDWLMWSSSLLCAVLLGLATWWVVVSRRSPMPSV